MSLARAAYSDSDIVLLDDPLSAVDAHVGRAILEDCLLSGPLSTKTRVLVTHSLHVLSKVDYIYVMDNGAIAEEGTFEVKSYYYRLVLKSLSSAFRYRTCSTTGRRSLRYSTSTVDFRRTKSALQGRRRESQRPPLS